MSRVVPGAAALAALVLLAAGCGGSKKSSEGGESGGKKATIAGVSANDHGTKEVSGETKVELDDYYFEPTVLKGKPGTQVTLELENEGSTEHNFSIDSQSIDQDVEPDKKATVTVKIPSSGQLSFYCKYHKSMGMAGALEAAGSAGGGGTTTTETTTTGGTSSRSGY
jgi:plastocyanin